MIVSPKIKETSEREEHLKNAPEPKTMIISKLERKRSNNNSVAIIIIKIDD